MFILIILLLVDSIIDIIRLHNDSDYDHKIHNSIITISYIRGLTCNMNCYFDYNMYCNMN